jgi:lipopolysaccharide transport system permease protein
VNKMTKNAMDQSTIVQTDPEKWDMVISPQRNLLDLRLRELWHARDLIMLFVRRDFVSIYKQTILGPLWYLIQPLLTTIVFTVVFGNIAKIPTDGLPPFLFYMCGTVIFSYFANCLSKTSDTFVSNAGMFGKVYFPRLAVPVSILISNLITFLIQFGFFLAFIVYFSLQGTVFHISWWVLLTPVLLIMMAGLGLGFGIIVSSLTTKYRDLRFLVQFGVQLLQYVTPVIYSLSYLSAKSPKYQALIRLNPLTSVVEAFRYAYLGSGSVNLVLLSYSFTVMVIVIAIGAVIFNRVEATFMDTV